MYFLLFEKPSCFLFLKIWLSPSFTLLFRLTGGIRLDDEVETIVIYDREVWPLDVKYIRPDNQRRGVLLVAHVLGIDEIQINDPLHSRKTIIGKFMLQVLF